MNQKLFFWLPPHLLLLDLTGFALLVIGLLEWFIQIGLIPEPLRFEHIEWLMIAVGIAMMLPLVVHIVFRLKQTSSPPAQ